MKQTSLLLVALMLFAASSMRAANEDLRAFVLSSDQVEANAIGTRKDGLLYGDQQFLLARYRNGEEVGRNIPAVWVTKPGFKWRTYVVSEKFSLGAVIKSVGLDGDVLRIEFSFPYENKSETYTIPIIVREDIGLVFLDGVGLEVQTTR